MRSRRRRITGIGNAQVRHDERLSSPLIRRTPCTSLSSLAAFRAVRDLPAEVKTTVTYLIVRRTVDVTYSEQLDQEIRASGRDIRRLGVVSLNKLRTLHQCSDIMLHTSVPNDRLGTAEGFGLVLLAASASGLPVIATETDAIPEVRLAG